MRTEPLAELHRRLQGRTAAASAGGGDEDAEDAEDVVAAPSWVPDGRPSTGPAWLAAVRADPGRAGAIALGGVAALAVLITLVTLARAQPPAVAAAKLPPVEPVPSSAPATPRPAQGPTPLSASDSTPAPSGAVEPDLVVSVVGLVHQPGLVTLTPGARIADAVTAAGGTLTGADTLGLNMARRVTDGEQIIVGIASPAGQRPVLGSSSGPGGGPAPASTGAKAPGPVDLNTATVEQLDGLPGVGPVTAAAIVAWRAANGRFTSIDQLAEVDGIGPGRLEKLRTLVRI